MCAVKSEGGSSKLSYILGALSAGGEEPASTYSRWPMEGYARSSDSSSGGGDCVRAGELRVRAARNRRWAEERAASSGSSERGVRRDRNQHAGSRRRVVGMPTTAADRRLSPATATLSRCYCDLRVTNTFYRLYT